MSRSAPRTRRGALLLEVILALAIFVMAGTAILAMVNRVMDGMARTKEVRHAADLAKSAMAQLEAGLGTAQSLNGPVKAWSPEEQGASGPGVGSGAAGAAADDAPPVRGSGVLATMPADSGWELQIDTEPSQFRGLTRVTVKAFKHAAGGPVGEAAGPSYTLRQLVRLSGKGEDVAGSADSLADQAKKGATEGFSFGNSGASGSSGASGKTGGTP